MSMRPALTFALSALTLQATALAQSIPEGIHSDVKGPSEMCGVTADNAYGFEAQVRANPKFRQGEGTNRFILFSSADETVQWVFATRSNTVFPLASCRQLSEGPDGALYLRRQMRCDASRDECDRAYLEFEALDDQVKDALSGGERG